MIIISKSEKEALKKQFPKAHITRTMKQKSKRHRYYCEETNAVINFLDKERKKNKSSNYLGKDELYTITKK